VLDACALCVIHYVVLVMRSCMNASPFSLCSVVQVRAQLGRDQSPSEPLGYVKLPVLPFQSASTARPRTKGECSSPYAHWETELMRCIIVAKDVLELLALFQELSLRYAVPGAFVLFSVLHLLVSCELTLQVSAMDFILPCTPMHIRVRT
jgi:hypothetical protein